MSDWQSIETAPKDRVILSYWRDTPVFIAWIEMEPTVRVKYTGVWPFKKKHVEVREESGWRVLCLDRNGQYMIHGNYAPYNPTEWKSVD